MRQYDLIVVSIEPFPYGQAATNRMLSYLVGLAKDSKVLYLCLGGPVVDSKNTLKKGSFKGIDFEYMCEPAAKELAAKPIRAAKLILRHVTLFVKLLLCYKAKSLILYSASRRLAKSLQSICRLKKMSIFRDITEIVGDNYSKAPQAVELMKRESADFTGMITISKGGYEFFDNLPDRKRFLLPVLVDMERFTPSQDKGKYVFCCSGANLERDGLLDSMEGFLMFREKYPEYKMLIASALKPSDPYHARCKALMDKNSEAIEYLGAIASYEIPSRLAHATALMLTPHGNYKTKGFPTKLGEYLASATPVICSSIDDISEVLPGDVAFMVEPNKPEQVAEALETIINEPDTARAIGLKAREFMNGKFTIEAYIEPFKKFLRLSDD